MHGQMFPQPDSCSHIHPVRVIFGHHFQLFAESGYIAYPSEYTFVFIAEPFGITVLSAFQIISQRSREIMLSSQMESFRYHPIVRLKSIGSFIRYRVIGSQCYSRQKLSFFPHTQPDGVGTILLIVFRLG